MIDDLPFMKVDERQLVRVVAAGGGQRVPVVGQRDDVQRQVGQSDVLAGRLQGPAVGQEEPLFRRARIARSFLGQTAPKLMSEMAAENKVTLIGPIGCLSMGSDSSFTLSHHASRKRPSMVSDLTLPVQ